MICFPTEKVPVFEIMLHHTRTTGVLWGFMWSLVALLCFQVILFCCFYARSPIRPTTQMGQYLERWGLGINTG